MNAPFVLLGGFGAYEFVEVTAFASGGFFLVEQSEIPLIEFFEEFIPRDLLQALFAAETGEIESQHPDVPLAPSTLYARRVRTALLCPPPNLFMILSGFGKIGHSVGLSPSNVVAETAT